MKSIPDRIVGIESILSDASPNKCLESYRDIRDDLHTIFV